MKTLPHSFRAHDLVAGHVVFDLVNTVTARNAHPVDWLDSYDRVLEWAALTQEFDARTLTRLRKLQAADRRAAGRALRRLATLREAMHAVFSAAIGGAPPPDDSLRSLDKSWKRAVTHTRIRVADGRGRLELDADAAGLDFIADRLALLAVELLQTLPAGRTRVCAGTHCGWLFIDSSKAGRRRWCDMATCGNAAKSRRFQEREHGRRSSRQGRGRSAS